MKIDLKDIDFLIEDLDSAEFNISEIIENFKDFNKKYYPEKCETDIPFEWEKVAKARKELKESYENLEEKLKWLENNCCNPNEDIEEAQATGN